MRIRISKRQWEQMGKIAGWTDEENKDLVEELGNSGKTYIIAAKAGHKYVYFCNSSAQGEKMIPNAVSMAEKFTSIKEAREKIDYLSLKYKGLTEWKII